MNQEDIEDHIRMEMNKDSEYDGEIQGSYCQKCGIDIDENEQHIIHHVPEHGEEELHSVYYCSVSCFRDYMDDLFSL